MVLGIIYPFLRLESDPFQVDPVYDLLVQIRKSQDEMKTKQAELKNKMLTKGGR